MKLARAVVCLALSAGCSGAEARLSPNDAARTSGDSGVCPSVAPATSIPGQCNISITAPSDSTPSVRHVPAGTEIAYCTNPPTSGAHYPTWADFQEYPSSVEWPYLVHSLEHGAILLLYRCEPNACPDDVARLRAIRDRLPADPACAEGVKRIIIAPASDLPSKFAAVAWNFSYAADCIDEPSLATFINEHYAKAPENTCAPGRPM